MIMTYVTKQKAIHAFFTLGYGVEHLFVMDMRDFQIQEMTLEHLLVMDIIELRL